MEKAKKEKVVRIPPVPKGENYWCMHPNKNKELEVICVKEERTQYDIVRHDRKNYFYSEFECADHLTKLLNKKLTQIK